MLKRLAAYLGFVDHQVEALRLVRENDEHEREEARSRFDGAELESTKLRADETASIRLGTGISMRGTPFPLLVPEDEFRGGGHGLVSGATGSGKSYLVVGLLRQLLARRPRGLILFDAKGELAKLMREVWIPHLVATTEQGQELGQRFAVIAPFDSSAIPPFQVLVRDSSIPVRLQAQEVATTFGATVGRDLGIIQRTILTHTLVVAIEAGLTLVDLPRLLTDQRVLARALRQTQDPDAKAYFSTRFGKERTASLGSLIARLEELTLHPVLTRMLGASSMIRFDQLLENAVTVVDLGGAPAGMAEVGRFFGQLIFRKVVRAIWTRRVEEGTEPVTLIADEFQELVGSDLAEDAARVLTLARSQRVFFWALFQQLSQVERLSPHLLRTLITNCNYQIQFRAPVDDTRRLAHVLPADLLAGEEGVRDLREPRRERDVREAREALLQATERLPAGTAFFLNRNRPYPATLFRSLPVPAADAEATVKELPAELLAALRRGVLVRPDVAPKRAAQEEPAALADTSVPTRQEIPPEEVLPEAPLELEGPRPEQDEAAPVPPTNSSPKRGRRPSLG